MRLSNGALRLNFVGQSLIKHRFEPPLTQAWNEIRDWLASGHVNFTNLEVSLRSKRAGGMMKSPEWTTSPTPDVLDMLTDLRFNLMSLANNHAWDLGPAGILDTVEEVERRGIVCAGTGADLEMAGRPAYLDTTLGRVALISMASGNLPEPAFATSTRELGELARPGINPLRVDDVITANATQFEAISEVVRVLPQTSSIPGADSVDFLGQRVERANTAGLKRVIQPADLSRNLSAIEEAASDADIVLVYFHQHHWEAEWQSVGSWMRDLAHKCIDAGAHAFLGHGVPMLQPIEIYKNRFISYSLGNFIFHPTNGPSSWPDRRCWLSLVVQADFHNGEWQRIRLRPISLAGAEALDGGDFSSHARLQPMPASSDQTREVLENLDQISSRFGTRLNVSPTWADVILEGVDMAPTEVS